MKILLFAASHRRDSINRKLVTMAQRHIHSALVETELAEYADFDMPLYNDQLWEDQGVPEAATALARRAQGADGIIIASPEYNWSFPGSLKNILDWTSRLQSNPLAGKTALLMSATPGGRGGILGLQHLKTPLEALQLFVFHKSYLLGKAHEAFAEDNRLVHAEQQQLFATILDQYVDFTHKLRTSR